MPRNAASSVEKNFTLGHVTEASGLNFPEHACTETENCVHGITGNVTRRLGVDFEAGYVTKTINRSGAAISEFLWRDVAGDSAVNLQVVQVGGTLHFWDIGTASALPGGAITATVTLSTYSPAGAPAPDTNECQFTSGNGFLFVTHPYLEPFSLSYSSASQTFTGVQTTISIRDFEGVNDSLAVDTRPTSTLAALSQTHYYNLLNQGWSVTNLTTWDTAFPTMPSNADVMWSFKNSSDAFDTATVVNGYRGNSPAPKGRYILNLFSQQRDTASGLTITDVTTGTNRCSTCAFFAGRMFYGGINSPGFGSKIAFTQIIESTTATDKFGACYQLNDPTSEDASEILPTDGGVVVIPEMGVLVKLVSLPGALIAFASNGIWSISGSTGIGFTASDYTVQKISTLGSLSASSFVEVEGSVYWWNSAGIWLIGQGQGGLSITSLTLTKNQSYFNTIPISCKQKARGCFNSLSRVIQWVYSLDESGSVTELYEFDRILNFNIPTQAFYNWNVDSSSDVKIHGVLLFGGGGGTITEQIVVDGSAVTVVDGAAETVVAYDIGTLSLTPVFKYLVSYADAGSYKFVFAESRDEVYEDWGSYTTPSTFESYFISGYRIRGDAQKKFQSNYVYVYSDNTSVGLASYYIQALWNYANTGDSGKWTSKQVEQAADGNFDNNIRRFKLRGSGLALQLKFSSLEGEPFDIIGWSSWETGNANV